MTENLEPLTADGQALILGLMQQSHNDYQHVSQQLIEGLTDENLKLHAELSLIRNNIATVLSGVFMPTSGHLLRLLWPSREEIADRVEETRPGSS